MIRTPLILMALIVAVCTTASTAAPVSVKEYASLRRQLASSAQVDAIKSTPSAYAGRVVEVRGKLAGVLRNSGGGSVIISTSAGSIVMNMAELPSDSPGVMLACLVKVGDTGDYEVKAWTYDAELRRLEEQYYKPTPKPQPVAQKTEPAPKTSQPQQKTSVQVVTAQQLLAAYKAAVKRFNPRLTDAEADTIARSVLGFSYRYKVDARLVCAVILAESHFRPQATSRAGAQGLGQLMPTTAAGLGVNNAYDPVANVYGCTRYIKGMLDRMSGNKHWNELTWKDLALALAAYNAGPGAVKKHGGIPPYRETQNYVRRVVSIYKQLCGVS